MKIISAISLLIYFGRRLLYYDGNTSLIEALWPFYLCNINTIFLSLSITLNIKKGRDFFLVTGLIGGISYPFNAKASLNRYLTFLFLTALCPIM